MLPDMRADRRVCIVSYVIQAPVISALVMNFKIHSYTPNVFEKMTPKHVCIYQCKHLGDCVLTLPLVNRILKSLPQDGRLSLIVQSSAQEIFLGIDSRLDVYSLPKCLRGWFYLIRSLVSVDLMFLPHASSRGLILSKLIGATCVGDSSLRAFNLLRPDHRVPRRLTPWRHTAEQYLDLARRVGIEIDTRDQVIKLDGLLSSRLGDAVSRRLPEKFVAINPGSRWLFKSPNEDFWLQIISLIEKSGVNVVLTGSDQGSEGQLLGSLSRGSGAISLAGMTSLSDLANVISRAYRYLGVDTFASHLASGTGTRGLVLFGPTSEKVWGPYGHLARTKVFTSTHSCRPCHSDGCGGGKRSECLDRLSPSQVVDVLFGLPE